MAFLDDYPHLFNLQKKYGVGTAPIEELREAAKLDGYENSDSMEYAPPAQPERVAPPRARSRKIRAARRLAIFGKLGISSTSSGPEQ